MYNAESRRNRITVCLKISKKTFLKLINLFTQNIVFQIFTIFYFDFDINYSYMFLNI